MSLKCLSKDVKWRLDLRIWSSGKRLAIEMGNLTNPSPEVVCLKRRWRSFSEIGHFSAHRPRGFCGYQQPDALSMPSLPTRGMLCAHPVDHLTNIYEHLFRPLSPQVTRVSHCLWPPGMKRASWRRVSLHHKRSPHFIVQAHEKCILLNLKQLWACENLPPVFSRRAQPENAWAVG